MVEPYLTVLTLLGIVILLTAWLPIILRRLPLSVPILCVILGIFIGMSPLSPMATNPLENRLLTERLTEFVVIIALMGAGLKIDRPLGWRRWIITWRLLGVAMPLTIAAIAGIGLVVMGLPWASALLLGAALAPTDPVLASDVQLGPPKSGEEDEVRFALTSEAGLNDGLSFPFVYLAITVASVPTLNAVALYQWFVIDVIWKLAAGVFCGWLIGKILGYVTFKLPKRTQLARSGDGLVAIGVTCVAYAVTEAMHGYGFIAVFVAALTLRAVERQHQFHEHMHNFTEQIERLLMMILMVFFGMIIGEGSLVRSLSWPIVAVAFLTLFLVRPVFGWLSLIGLPGPADEKTVIGFFGIRGLGSLYYLAYATSETKFEAEGQIWTTVFLIVLISVLVHGSTVTPIMKRLDSRRTRM